MSQIAAIQNLEKRVQSLEIAQRIANDNFKNIQEANKIRERQTELILTTLKALLYRIQPLENN